ncbi:MULTISPECIES: alpha/beta fold hydrolase [Enterococcus]|uniref:Alpha/beta fold hydrolase n=1 Tax=Enterococcus faecium TaxID=1352 RepID=A0A2A7T087_ENTFC|nr:MULTISPECIES: alpha/beta fold hydrolase [Enterococcus]AII39863.1 hypothetical protein M395_11405 [Enterococcus faecium T110]AYM73905.1 alpha/beta fold hydrolase [Enterococcus faecium]EGP5687431.1 alpha/beta fold hydrolase [Enterococcus faecium]EME8086286.1 alpha/beta fold hydrolase [Enterococcus faecium]EME8110928.1 alpha/beta fold hydrolase [Enterococcus faecium]
MERKRRMTNRIKNVCKHAATAALVLISLFAISGCQTTKTKTTVVSDKEKTVESSKVIEKTTIPTLFFHGYSGTENSFKGMLQRLEKNQKAVKELVLIVGADGQIQAEGDLSGKADNPMVQVLFEDNKNNEWNQAEWIKSCLLYLKENEGIDKVNIVGHSMGGVSALRYLGTYGQDTSLPQVQTFTAIGAPFNDFVDDSGQSLTEELAKGPAVVSSRYQDYQQMIGNMPTTTRFFLIAGQLDEADLSDGTVPLNSALAVYALLKQHGNEVEEKIVKGENAAHSMLHENQEVDQLVSRFVWNE